MARDPGIVRLGRGAAAAAAALVVLGATVIVFRRGLVSGDEGYLVGQSLAIAAGKVPYRDLDMFVAPVSR